jgi:hypothetical protein
MRQFPYHKLQHNLPSYLIRFCILSAVQGQQNPNPNSIAAFRTWWIDADVRHTISRMVACHSRDGSVNSIEIQRIVSDYHVAHEPNEFDWNVVVHAARILKRFPLSQIHHLFNLPSHVFGTTSLFHLGDCLVEGRAQNTFDRMIEGPWKKMFSLSPYARSPRAV